jgi:hypothetical protein
VDTLARSGFRLAGPRWDPVYFFAMRNRLFSRSRSMKLGSGSAWT